MSEKNLNSGKFQKYNQSKFLELAKDVHGTLYDYSKVEYDGISKKVKIVCSIHGDFEQTPSVHLSGSGCQKCGTMKTISKRNNTTLTQQQFLVKARLKHGDKYDYSNSKYNGYHRKIKIICKQHGEFQQSAHGHVIGGYGCKLCSKNHKSNTKQFIEKSQKVHKGLYTYEKTQYNGNKEKVIICCKKHGQFLQTPDSHLSGKGCQKCKNLKDLNYFTEKANKIHDNKYDYSKTLYVHGNKKVQIICLKHGSFFQTPCSHLREKGCPSCASSKGQNKIQVFLKQREVKYIKQKTFSTCVSKTTGYILRFDFYLPDYNTCIEFNGQQHFRPVKFSKNISQEQVLKQFEKLIQNDDTKQEYCIKKGIKFIKVKYDQVDIFGQILKIINCDIEK